MDGSTPAVSNSSKPTRPARRVASSLPAISKQTADLLLREPLPVDAIALYWFYLYVATWQCTNRPRATTAYCALGLHITADRVRAAKKVLIRLGLVADYVDRDKTGRARGWYVHLKYIRSGKNHSNDLPESGSHNPVADNQQNASSADIGNASIPPTENALTPNPLSGGEGGDIDNDVRVLGAKLLVCLEQDPARHLTENELRALKAVTIQIPPNSYERLCWFYKADPDNYDRRGPEQRVLRSRKMKLAALAMELPQQIEFARQWAESHPIWRPPPPPPPNWHDVLISLHPDAAHMRRFEDLPRDVQAVIREKGDR